MASKAEAILNKHKGSMDYIKGDVSEIYTPNLLEALKEIASIAFEAGEARGETFMISSKTFPSKQQFIDNLFNNE